KATLWRIWRRQLVVTAKLFRRRVDRTIRFSISGRRDQGVTPNRRGRERRPAHAALPDDHRSADRRGIPAADQPGERGRCDLRSTQRQPRAVRASAQIRHRAEFGGDAPPQKLSGLSMIRKSGYRFSEKIMLQHKL